MCAIASSACGGEYDGMELDADEVPALTAMPEPSPPDLGVENERLRRAAKLQTELVTAVAHELRTPLASVLGFTEILLKRELEPAARERCLRIINTEAQRLANLVDELFDVRLMVEGGADLTLETFDLAAVLAQQVDLFSVQSEAHSLRIALPPHPLLVRAERHRIAQVVANLLSNAIKYSPAGGVVVVGAETHDGFVRVTVRDEGVGIRADQHHLVFSRFFRADSSSTSAVRGMGLGLALSREIVHAHGGSFGFESAPDEGSTFWFELREHRGAELAPDRGAAPQTEEDEA